MAFRNTPKNASFGGVNYNGVQMAKVKRTSDKNHNGKIFIWLTGSNTDETDEANWITAIPSSPYTGLTERSKIDGGSVQDEDSSQRSYGMRFPPPRTDNKVLVAFVGGDPSQCYIVGNIGPDGYSGSLGHNAGNTYQTQARRVEMNAHSQQIPAPLSQPTVPHSKKNDKFTKMQGVQGDKKLGPGESSWYHREETDQDFSVWSTPHGNHIIMDDDKEKENILIRIRNDSGQQILLYDVDDKGFIFMINQSGHVWGKMNYDGNFDIYCFDKLNVFATNDINLRSDKDIHIQALNNIHIKADDTVYMHGANNIHIKAPPWKILQSPTMVDVYSAISASQSPPGAYVPIGDPPNPANPVTRKPIRAGKYE